MHFLDGRANVYADATLTNKYEKQMGQRKGRTLTAYERLKRRILREFPKKKLVGDIAIDDDEFQILVEYLKSFYTFTRLSGWSLCIDPLVCVTMVQIGIRYYDGGYWPHFSKVLNDNSWSINRQALMGKICINTLKAFDKAVLDENDRINTILMHGFVANKYVPSLLDFLYAYYKIDLERDLGRNDRSMMKELIRSIQSKDNTNRTYKLVQQTADAVLCNPTPLLNDNTRVVPIEFYHDVAEALMDEESDSKIKRVFSDRCKITNEKYTFRVWLMRLGMMGSEYKTARKLLLRNLKGNAAFRTKDQAEIAKDKLKAQRDAEKEIAAETDFDKL